MIAYISGVVVDKGNDYIIVDNQGIGYHIFYGLPETVPLHESGHFHTYQHVREDAIILFGFPTKSELQLFMQLINVKGVGPKTGLTILSKVSASDLIQAVAQEDLKFLKSLPGVGPKMASQMLLDLKGKFVAVDESKPAVTSSNKGMDEAIDALIALGFKRQEINTIMDELLATQDASLNEQIRVGLQLLNARKRGK